MQNDNTLVILKDEGVLGVVISGGPHISQVMFVKNGMQYIVVIENDDLVEVNADDFIKSAEVLD